MKKILMIGDSVYPDTMGGSHRHIYDISKRLAEQGNLVYVFSPQSKKTTQKTELSDRFTILRYNRSCNAVKGFVDFFFGPLRLFRRMLRTSGCPDVIHGHWPLTCFFIWIYVRLKRLPVRLVYTFHGPVVEEYAYELKYSKLVCWTFLKIVRLAEFWVLHLSDVISTASHYMKAKEIALYGNEDKVVVNYLAIDERKFDIVDCDQYPMLFEKNRYKYIFTLRRLKKRMGIQLLIEAFAKVIQTQGHSFKLLIGGKGDYKAELEALTVKLGVDKDVVFLGFLDDDELKKYYSASDVCVVPSLDLEGFGLTTAEAMACGTPVVATDVCANTEILSGITPEYLVRQDAEMMADAIVSATGCPVESEKLRNYILKTFNWEKTISGYLELYK